MSSYPIDTSNSSQQQKSGNYKPDLSLVVDRLESIEWDMSALENAKQDVFDEFELELVSFLHGKLKEEASSFLMDVYWTIPQFSNLVRKIHRKFVGVFHITPRPFSMTCPICKSEFCELFSSWANYQEALPKRRPSRWKINGRECKNCRNDQESRSQDRRLMWEIEQKEHLRWLEECRSIPYVDYLQTEHWKSVRKKALYRAEFSCQLCNAKGGRLDVHHRTYERLGEEKWNDLIVLCRPCHKKHHDIMEDDHDE